MRGSVDALDVWVKLWLGFFVLWLLISCDRGEIGTMRDQEGHNLSSTLKLSIIRGEGQSVLWAQLFVGCYFSGLQKRGDFLWRVPCNGEVELCARGDGAPSASN